MISVAIAGVGRMGGVHAGNLAGHPRLRLTHVVDADEQRRGNFCRATGAAPATLDEVLADPRIGGLIVATPTDTHLEVSRRAVRAGKAVFCEKPLGMEPDALRAAAAEFEAPGTRLFVAFNRRFDPHYRGLKDRLDEGAIGPLESLHLVNHDPAAPPLHFIPTSGGLFRDFTVHDFDMARWLLGEEPVEVFAWASCLVDPAIEKLGDVDTAKILLTTASGRLCAISNTRRSGCGYDQRIEAFGAKGCLRVDNVRNNTVEAWDATGAHAAGIPETFIQRYAAAYRAEMDHFADVLEGRCRPAAGFADNLRAMLLAQAAARSLKSGAAERP